MALRDFPFGNKLEQVRQNQSQASQAVAIPAKGELFKFTHPSHGSHILDGLHKQWSAGQFLDVTVKINDIRVRAHKCVLSSFSKYFEALFSSNMSDSALDEIQLHDVNGNAIKMLISFAYCGSLDITPENVQDLLVAANFLCIDSVISACCSYLQDNLSVENCIDIHGFALSLDKTELQRNIEMFIISHFEEMVHDDHFLKMPVELLIRLLERDDMKILENGFCVTLEEQEEKILKAVLRFVEGNPEMHHKHLPLLLSRGVRLLLLTPATLTELKSCDLIKSSPECSKLINRVLSSEISNEERELWEETRLLIIRYEMTRVLANSGAVQSELPSEPFDDSKIVSEGQCIFVTGMKIYTRRWDGKSVVGGMEVSYNTGHSILHGSAGYGYEDYEFCLSSGERIIAINARVGWMVDQLIFTTNRGNVFGPYGGPGGSKKQLLCPCEGAYLAYVTGSVDITQSETAVRKLCFAWGFCRR